MKKYIPRGGADWMMVISIMFMLVVAVYPVVALGTYWLAVIPGVLAVVFTIVYHNLHARFNQEDIDRETRREEELEEERHARAAREMMG